MLDRDLILSVRFAELVAVNEYLRQRGDEQVCSVLDDVVEDFQTVFDNLKQE